MRLPHAWLAPWLVLGCAGSAPEATAADRAHATAGAEAGSLAGRWAQYWSVTGEVATEEHVFAPDGDWTWRAAPGATAPVTTRAGRWRLDGGALVLSVESEQDVPRDPPIEERLDVGECPPNDEARSIDAGYDCKSFDGRAFWRSTR